MTQGEKLAYLAGLLDGEGWLGIVRHKTTGLSLFKFSPRIACGMTKIAPLLLLQEQFGGTLKEYPWKTPRSNWANPWIWRVGGQKAITVCAALFSYLQLKKPQASLMLEFDFTTKHHLTLDEHKHREWLWQQCRELNRKGRPSAGLTG